MLDMRFFVGIALLLVAASFASACAQLRTTTVRFEHLTIADGLSDNEVFAGMQDRRGFIWIGTENGLNRYNGYDFTIFRQNPADTVGLVDSSIYDLIEASDGTIWAATFAGLTRYDPRTDGFTTYAGPNAVVEGLPQLRYNHLLEDRNGRIWAAGRAGLHVIDPGTGSVKSFPDEGDGEEFLWAGLAQSSDGTVWAALIGDGLRGFDPTTYSVSRHLDEELDGELAIPQLEDDEGALWLAGRGIYRYEPSTGALDHFLPDPDAPATSDKNTVNTIHQDRNGRIWLGMATNGLFEFDPAARAFVHHAPDPADPTSLAANTVDDIYEDDNGVLWIATSSGLDRWDPRRAAVTRLTYPALEGFGFPVSEDQSGHIWIGSDEGAIRYDPVSGTSTHYRENPNDPMGLGSNLVTDFYDHPGEPNVRWIGYAGGTVDRLNLRTGNVDHYRLRDVPHGVNAPVSSMYASPNRPNVLWVAIYPGLCKLEIDSGNQKCDTANDGESGSLPNPYVDTLEPDPIDPDIVWVGMDGGGLSRFNTKTELFTHHFGAVRGDSTTLSVPFVLPIHASRFEPGVLWIGTFGGGINRFEIDSGIVTDVFTEQNSELPSNVAGTLTEDTAGAIWAGTRSGLVRINPADGRVRTMNPQLGLSLAHEVELSGGGKTHIVVGMRGAVYYFDPNRIVARAEPPRVVLTEMRLFDQTVRPGPESPLRQPLDFTNSIRLRYAQRDVSFSYAALDFTHPEGNRYAYRLEGYDDSWREVGMQRQATYTNLPPGRYTFRVKAANSEGVWNEEGAAVELTILPPWWRSWWAYGFYGVLFLGGVFAVDRFQRRRLIAKERERARERELEQAREIERAYKELKMAKDRLVQQEKMASLGQLTAGIAHEIKNPLNFVNNFAGLSEELVEELRAAMKEGNADEVDTILSDLSVNTSKISEHGQRADSIVRSMMLHARGESGKREHVDLNALIEEYVDLAYHGKRAQVPDFNVEIEKHLAAEVGTVDIVPQDIGRVVLNLFGNAFDAVHERAKPEAIHERAKPEAIHERAEPEAIHERVGQEAGAYLPRVTVSTRRHRDVIEICIADNGPGIPGEVREKIFEPFFTTKPTGSGTGLGLSLSYDIVTQGHGGSLTVESADGQGASFVVRIPAGTTVPE